LRVPIPVLIDCDPGIDDALALLLAAASPELDIVAVTVVAGNSTVEHGAHNARAVLALAGRTDVPVAQGCAAPLVKPLVTAPETHGPTGMGYARLPVPAHPVEPGHAVQALIEQAERHAGALTVVAIGPLTNLAIALRLQPRLVTQIAHCIVMGGAIRHQGNVTMGAEYNVWVDPHAAHIVLHSGLPVTLVPLDVTYQCLFTSDHARELLRAGSRVARFVDDATRFYIEFHRAYQNIDGCAINDALALALAFQPDLVHTKRLFVDVDTNDSLSHATTFADFWNTTQKPPNADVALEVDNERFMRLFGERLAALRS
jgi:purine nucleosidase